ncbi:MAG TPA: STY0301 family protein [Janthinobacterium sp.]|nr:STY0301 family protein [Janthinobacterium sp.]
MVPTLLLAVVALSCAAANAQQFKCPEFYPDKEATLSEIPLAHQGGGLVRGASLSNAFFYIGALHGKSGGFDSLVGPEDKKVKGGWDTEYDFTPQETRWLVCVYGGNESSGGKQRIQGISSGGRSWIRNLLPAY